jgi:hypothetical protein
VNSALAPFWTALILAFFIFVALVGWRAILNKHAAFLFSLSAPGALYSPFLIAGLWKFAGPIATLIVFPAVWILPPICCFQLSRLRKTARKIDAITCIGAAMIIGLYFAASVMLDALRHLT